MSFSPLLCGDCVATEQRRKNIRGGPAALRTSLPEATLDGLQPAAPPGERKRPRRACGPPHLPATDYSRGRPSAPPSGNCLCWPAARRSSLRETASASLRPSAPPSERLLARAARHISQRKATHEGRWLTAPPGRKPPQSLRPASPSRWEEAHVGGPPHRPAESNPRWSAAPVPLCMQGARHISGSRGMSRTNVDAGWWQASATSPGSRGRAARPRGRVNGWISAVTRAGEASPSQTHALRRPARKESVAGLRPNCAAPQRRELRGRGIRVAPVCASGEISLPVPRRA